MLYAQVGHHHLARATETSPERSSGHLSCLSARPHDLAFWTGTRPRVVGVSPSIVPFVYSKRAAAARSPGSRYRRSSVLWPLRANQPWNYPIAFGAISPVQGYVTTIHLYLLKRILYNTQQDACPREWLHEIYTK